MLLTIDLTNRFSRQAPIGEVPIQLPIHYNPGRMQMR
ncbi:MAG: hypothetical protein HLUCCO16_11465 [Phormidium sp. OSCR]|nr:MAG: hypothetical protein HLUCCO16_11465 [Phormidium sp. OSCR]